MTAFLKIITTINNRNVQDIKGAYIVLIGTFILWRVPKLLHNFLSDIYGRQSFILGVLWVVILYYFIMDIAYCEEVLNNEFSEQPVEGPNPYVFHSVMFLLWMYSYFGFVYIIIPDMSFPRLNNISFWLLPVLVLILSIFMIDTSYCEGLPEGSNTNSYAPILGYCLFFGGTAVLAVMINPLWLAKVIAVGSFFYVSPKENSVEKILPSSELSSSSVGLDVARFLESTRNLSDLTKIFLEKDSIYFQLPKNFLAEINTVNSREQLESLCLNFVKHMESYMQTRHACLSKVQFLLNELVKIDPNIFLMHTDAENITRALDNLNFLAATLATDPKMIELAKAVVICAGKTA